MNCKLENWRMSYLQWRKTWYKTIANLIRGQMVYEDIRGQLKVVRK